MFFPPPKIYDYDLLPQFPHSHSHVTYFVPNGNGDREQTNFTKNILQNCGSKTEFRYILFFPSHPSFMKNSRMNFQIHFLRPLPFYPVFLSVVHLPFPWPWSVPSPLFPRRTFFIHRRPIGEAEYWHPREGMNPPNTEANLTFPFQFSFYTLEDAAQNLLKVVSSIPSLFLSVKYSQTTHPPSADGKKGLSRTHAPISNFLIRIFFFVRSNQFCSNKMPQKFWLIILISAIS